MKQRILITGASSGFGYLAAKLMRERGHEIVGTMRSTSGKNEEVAAELSSLGIHLVELDVTKDDSVNAGVEQVLEKLGGLDIVINNAGVGVIGMQEHFTPKDMRYLFEVNVFGVHRLLRAVLPHLRAQQKGVLLFVTSLLGRVTIPFYGPYNASKWALEALAENYRAELSGFGIESCIVEPGGFQTDFMHNLIQPSDDSRDESYGEFMKAPQAFFEGFGETLANSPAQKPETVAVAIADLVDTPHGERPFRTVVDFIGMGDAIKPYNEMLDNVTQGLYSSIGIDGMLNVKKE